MNKLGLLNKVSVSVIIPTYNRSNLIIETLHSIQNQSYQYWECIIIDDHSTDNTGQIIKEYIVNDSRFKYYLNAKAKGAQGARNTGIEKSQGEYLIFLDSDDLLAPNCIENRLAFASENPGQDFYCFATALFKQQPGDTPLLWNYLNTEVNDIVRFLRQDMPWHTSGVLWRKEMLLQLNGWDEQVKSWQDWDIHLRALIYNKSSYKKCDQQEVDSYYRLESDKNAISSKWLSEASKNSYIYLIRKFVVNDFFQASPYRFELAKLSFRLSRLIYNSLDKSAGIQLFQYSQQQLGYSDFFSFAWVMHIILSRQNSPYLLRKVGNIIPRLFKKTQLNTNYRTHLTANIYSANALQ